MHREELFPYRDNSGGKALNTATSSMIYFLIERRPARWGGRRRRKAGQPTGTINLGHTTPPHPLTLHPLQSERTSNGNLIHQQVNLSSKEQWWHLRTKLDIIQNFAIFPCNCFFPNINVQPGESGTLCGECTQKKESFVWFRSTKESGAGMIFLTTQSRRLLHIFSLKIPNHFKHNGKKLFSNIRRRKPISPCSFQSLIAIWLFGI